MAKIKESVELFSASVAHIILGEQDKHLRNLEKHLSVEIFPRGTHLSIQGEAADVIAAKQMLLDLERKVKRGQVVSAQDIEWLIQNSSAAGHGGPLLDIDLGTTRDNQSISPKTINQRAYIEAIESSDMVFAWGPAGTGKTYLAMAMAVRALLRRQVRRIVLTRPAVEAGEKLGFLPGDLEQKVNPYLRPLLDALHDMMDDERAHNLVERGTIEIAPLAFMRGRTLNQAFVILDEAQNTSPAQMKMFLTRIGFGTKVVVTGDVTQVDLPKGSASGLADALQVLQNIPGIATIALKREDVVRNPLIQRIIDAYEQNQCL